MSREQPPKVGVVRPGFVPSRPFRNASVAAVASWAWALLPGCTEFAPASDRLDPAGVTEVTLTGRADATPVIETSSDWSCLDDPPATNPSLSFAGMVSYAVPVRSLFGAPLVNVRVSVCTAADFSCATPVTQVAGLDASSVLSIQVPVGFNGFLEIQAEGHLPTVFYMRKPVFANTEDPLPILPIPAAGVPQLAMIVGTEVVAELAIMAVAVIDCHGQRAPGVAFSNNLGGRVFYFVDGVPSAAATVTDPQGLGGFVNAPLRLSEVQAHVEASGRLIGERTLLPRAGWLNVVQLRPPALSVE
jgi:hypothetical protein